MEKRSNEAWLADLQGPNRESALADLRELLIRGLRFTLSSRVNSNLDALVEDFAQEALLKILDNLDTFRGESQFTTWAQKIAVRVALTELRRKRWQDTSLEVLTTSRDGTMDLEPIILADKKPSPERTTAQQQMLSLVNQLIENELTDKQREAIVNVMIKGMPLEEVATRMGSNRNALYKLIHDARLRLKKRLEAENLSPDDVLSVF